MRPTPLDLELMRVQSFAANLFTSNLIHTVVDEMLAAEDFVKHSGPSDGWPFDPTDEAVADAASKMITLNRVALMFENLGICA